MILLRKFFVLLLNKFCNSGDIENLNLKSGSIANEKSYESVDKNLIYKD